MDVNWEGAEIIAYLNGNEFPMDLSNKQFEVVAKILGLKYQPDGRVFCYSDETLERLQKVKGNPLQFVEVN